MLTLKLALLFAAGILVGVAVAAAVVWFYIYPTMAKEKYRYGHEMGELRAQIELGTKIPDALGRDVDPHEPIIPLWSAKTESVVIVTRHGVKTLRLCCDG